MGNIYRFNNYEVYVGDDEYPKNNYKCPGGPHMKLDDPNSFTTVTDIANGSGTIQMWNYGKEIWCNHQGRYMHIVADVKDSDPNWYVMSLCNIGIIGEKYVRSNMPPSSILLS